MYIFNVVDLGILQFHPCLTSKERETWSIFAKVKQTTRQQCCGCGRLRAETNNGGKWESKRENKQNQANNNNKSTCLHQRPLLSFTWNSLLNRSTEDSTAVSLKWVTHSKKRGKGKVLWREKNNLILHNFFLVTFWE